MSEEKKEEATVTMIDQETGPLSESIQLFKHESYTDGHLVYLDVMTPVKISGSGKVSMEKDKQKQFIGKSQVDFGGRVMPYTFMIEGVDNVKDAIDQFDNAMEKALERTKEKMEEMRKESENKLVVPNKPSNIITV